MSSQSETSCPITVPVPISVTVNTSNTAPAVLVADEHPLSATNGGFTRISEFTFVPFLSSTPVDGFDYSLQTALGNDLSLNTAVWDFGDGHTLSGHDAFTATHIYNVPGIYTVSVFFYDKDGMAHINTLTDTVSVYNYGSTRINIAADQSTNPDTTIGEDNINSSQSTLEIQAGQKPEENINTLRLGITASWQDVPDPNEPQTVYFTVSGSKAKPYDVNNKYAHLIPYNAIYDENLNLINNNAGVKYALAPHYFFVSQDNRVAPITGIQQTNKFLLYSSTRPAPYTGLGEEWTTENIPYQDYTTIKPESGRKSFYYYDDIPNYKDGERVNLIIRLDTSKHKLKGFYVDNITTDINNSGKNYLETNYAGTYSGVSGTGAAGVPIRVLNTPFTRLSFTSTGMKEMSAIQYKRQGDKFQIFIGLGDDKFNVLKNHPIFNWTDTQADIGVTGTEDYTFYANWTSGGDVYTANISSISTNKFPYNTATEKTELSSFLYTNIDPLSAGTWTLNVSAKINSLSTYPTGYGENIATGVAGYGQEGSGLGEVDTTIINNSYTFTIAPSTNDVEIYKVNEDIDYSQTIKSYRFQSFLHEYDKLFDGVFTSFVGQASSSPTTVGKTIFEKTANFVANNSDIDFCKIENIQAFYDFFNEDIDFLTPTPPPELKRLYDLFSIKISKLLGDYERVNDSLDTNFYTSSADNRNIDLTSPITSLTYEVSSGISFIARQKLNNQFILIKPQKVGVKATTGVPLPGELTTYPLSTYNVYSNFGWPLDTSVSGASGLDMLYEFYPYTAYDTTSAENIQNSIIDYTNSYTTISRSTSSLSGSWENDNGIIFKNLDYQIRKGLKL